MTRQVMYTLLLVTSAARLLIVFLDREMAQSQLYNDPFSNKAVQMSFFCCSVGFIIRTVAFCLFFLVEKKGLCGCISFLEGSFIVKENGFPGCCRALIKLMADVMYDLISRRVSLS